MRTVMRALLVSALLLVVTAVPPSRFNKKIDDTKLEKEWQDEESDEWHEDTFEWKRKEAQKKAKPLDLAAITAGGMTGGAKDMLLQHEAGSGNMQMAFATLRKGVAKNEKEINELAGKWQALLQTNGVKISFHPIGGDDLLLTEDGGRIIEARDFILNQPEVEKFRWKDTDFTPTPTPQPAEQAPSYKKSSGKGRTGKDKKGSKKAAATPSAKPKKGKAAKQQKAAGKGGDARDEL